MVVRIETFLRRAVVVAPFRGNKFPIPDARDSVMSETDGANLRLTDLPDNLPSLSSPRRPRHQQAKQLRLCLVFLYFRMCQLDEQHC